MWRIFWTWSAVVCVITGALVWASTQVTFLFYHPRTAGVRVEIDKRTGAAVVMRPVAAAAPQTSPGGQPRADVPTARHDFGTMDPLTVGEHDFAIHNGGTTPLKLRTGPTTCKCTLSGLARGDVPPGESTTVRLTWNTGRDERYEHAATVFTNDPARPSIELRVAGRVRVLIAADQPEISLGTLDPDRPTIVERLIYSQTISDFAVQDLQAGIQGVQWEAAGADDGAAERLGAKHVQRLRLTFPAGLATGPFADVLRLTIQPAGGQQDPVSLELPLTGTVPRRLAFYGAEIDSTGLIELGDVDAGQAKRIQLLAKVRDAELDLPAAQVEAFPSFLQARFEPLANKRGLYQLLIELPGDAPACQYQSDPIGRVRINTGHPRIGVVELKLSFAVVPRRSL